MKDYAIDKISKIERFMNRIIDVNVIMDIQRMDHRVEIILKAGNTKITSKASSTDMYVSIDQAVDKLEKQILRYKSKLQDHHAKGHAILNMTVNVLSPGEIEEDFDEAIMKMELSGDAFMLFKCEEDQKLKVIYRRQDENYGIIEPAC
jgi:putative sigma-54 modulation protein